MPRLFFPLLLALLTFGALAPKAFSPLAPGSASAHAVYVFAYSASDQICSESYFSRKNRVQGGRVSLLSPNGTLLESGVTDGEGTFCFKSPDVAGDLIVAVEAGEGHRGEFILRASERSDSPSASFSPASPSPAPAETVEAGPAAAGPPAFSPQDARALQNFIRAELRDQLKPIVRALAEAENDQSPTLRNVVGGLGWIAGLLGLIFWRLGRRRPSPPPSRD
ncbi:MAG: hypothetical protein LBO66_00225 [Deltaproteobacteria bacterium]|jgi:nickel transport protein|nr:hypothetical protein [Deltaproteobacteria bacterium]